MLKEERHQKILNEVSLRNRVLLNDIAEHLDVSVDTVRRDVKADCFAKGNVRFAKFPVSLSRLKF